MQVFIYGKVLKNRDIAVMQDLMDVLAEENINVFMHTPFLEQIKDKIKFPKDVAPADGYRDLIARKIDICISMGGDGTMLNSTTIIRDSNIPIMGINLGRLGLLATVDKKEIRRAIEMVQRGQYSLDERSLLQLESNLNIFRDANFALNDCTLLKRDTSSMIQIHTFINGAFLTTYWADGIIIGTPTGSTGYSLSCGGPIIFPNSGNFVITPVAPHNLSVRPIVISDDSVLSFEVEGRAENFLCTLDSRFEMIKKGAELAIRKADFTVKFILLDGDSFLKTIREKLVWGMDPRNYNTSTPAPGPYKHN